jgi:hypothetical protein
VLQVLQVLQAPQGCRRYRRHRGCGYAGVANSSVDNATGDITLGSRFINSYNAAGIPSAPPGTFTGTWFTNGTPTTTKPQVLIEPTGTTSTGWSTSGTGIGVNAASGFAGRLLDLQVAATLKLPNLPTYADNAAATTGGLVAGDVYKTATGELRITV